MKGKSQRKPTVMVGSSSDVAEYHQRALEILRAHRLSTDSMYDGARRTAPHPVKANSLEMVAQSDVYLLIIGARYGRVVTTRDGSSMTEMEYDLASDLKRTRYAIILDWDLTLSTWKSERVPEPETAKVQGLRQKLMDPVNGLVIDSFKDLPSFEAAVTRVARQVAALFDLSDDPAPDVVVQEPTTPLIAHPYVLLNTKTLVGRERERTTISKWYANEEKHILVVEGLGGSGKSALVWAWFKQEAALLLPNPARRVWWSFYEEGSSFPRFLVRTLAHLSGRPEADFALRSAAPSGEVTDDAEQAWRADVEAKLRDELEREPALIVLDGFERLLNLYAGHDAAHRNEEEIFEDLVAKFAKDFQLTPQQARARAVDHLRAASDPRNGSFLAAFVDVTHAKVILTTRNCPGALLRGKNPLPWVAIPWQATPGRSGKTLSLSESDACKLWWELLVDRRHRPLHPDLARMLKGLGYHALTLQLLAEKMETYAAAYEDYFEEWRRGHPEFSVFEDLDIKQRKTFVLKFSLQGLSAEAIEVLDAMSAERGTVGFPRLRLLIVNRSALFPNDEALVAALNELNARGLIGWGRDDASLCDMHPLVRSFTHEELRKNIERRERTYRNRAELARVEAEKTKVEPGDASTLKPLIDYFDARLNLAEYEDATKLLLNRIDTIARFNIGDNHISFDRYQWLKTLLSPADSAPQPLSKNFRGLLYIRLAEAAGRLSRHEEASKAAHTGRTLLLECRAWSSVAEALLQQGWQNVSGRAAPRIAVNIAALQLARERHCRQSEWIAYALRGLAIMLAVGGRHDAAEECRRSAAAHFEWAQLSYEAVVMDQVLAGLAGDLDRTLEYAMKRWQGAHDLNLGYGAINAALAVAEAYLARGDWDNTETWAERTAIMARQGAFVQREIDARLLLAKNYLARGDSRRSKNELNQISQISDERTFAQELEREMAVIELDDGRNHTKAIASAATMLERIGKLELPGEFQTLWRRATKLLEREEALPDCSASILGALDAVQPLDAMAKANLLPPEEARQVIVALRPQIVKPGTTHGVIRWMEGFEKDMQPGSAAYLYQVVADRHVSISDLHLAVVYSNANSVQANLDYLDYRRRKSSVEAAIKSGKPDETMTKRKERVMHDSALELLEACRGKPWWKLLLEHYGHDLATWKADLLAVIDFKKTTGSALKWWESLGITLEAQPLALVALGEEIALRRGTIVELFLAFVYSNTDDLIATLHYFDYTRLKREEEKKKRLDAVEAKKEQAKDDPFLGLP